MFAIPTDPGEDRMISGMRLVLAVAAFVMTVVAPNCLELVRRAHLFNLILYLVYSFVLLAPARVSSFQCRSSSRCIGSTSPSMSP